MKKKSLIQVLVKTSNNDSFRNNIVTIEIPEEAAMIISKAWNEDMPIQEAIYASALASNQDATCVLRINKCTLASVSPMASLRSIEDVFDWHDIEQKNCTLAEYDIPKNDYVQPKEIRREVVQGIIKSLLWYIDNHISYEVDECNNGLYITNGGLTKESKKSSATRIHGAEMNAAFIALSEAGYYLFTYYDNEKGRHIYFWSKKPMLGTKKPTKDVSFNVFID